MLPEIFQFDFMLRAFAVGLVVAVTAPVIGTFLVVRRLSPIADTLAHASLLGVAIALLAGVAPVPVALAIAVIIAIGIELVRSGTKTYGESVLVLFMTGSLGLAMVLISLAHGMNANLLAYLFGSITTVTPTDLALIGGLGLVVLTTIRLAYRPLFLVALDEELAAASGIPVRRYNLLLVVLAAITIGLALRIVGGLLIGAISIIPVITAMQLRLSFSKTMFAAVGFALIATIAGLTASYYLDLAPGGSIVVVLVALFLATAGVQMYFDKK